jgi:hypothetical protein
MKLFKSNTFVHFFVLLISLSFTCVAAIGNLSEQAGFALEKRFGLFLFGFSPFSFLGKQKKSFH